MSLRNLLLALVFGALRNTGYPGSLYECIGTLDLVIVISNNLPQNGGSRFCWICNAQNDMAFEEPSSKRLGSRIMYDR